MKRLRQKRVRHEVHRGVERRRTIRFFFNGAVVSVKRNFAESDVATHLERLRRRGVSERVGVDVQEHDVRVLRAVRRHRVQRGTPRRARQGQGRIRSGEVGETEKADVHHQRAAAGRRRTFVFFFPDVRTGARERAAPRQKVRHRAADGVAHGFFFNFGDLAFLRVVRRRRRRARLREVVFVFVFVFVGHRKRRRQRSRAPRGAFRDCHLLAFVQLEERRAPVGPRVRLPHVRSGERREPVLEDVARLLVALDLLREVRRRRRPSPRRALGEIGGRLQRVEQHVALERVERGVLPGVHGGDHEHRGLRASTVRGGDAQRGVAVARRPQRRARRGMTEGRSPGERRERGDAAQRERRGRDRGERPAARARPLARRGARARQERLVAAVRGVRHRVRQPPRRAQSLATVVMFVLREDFRRVTRDFAREERFGRETRWTQVNTRL